MQLRRVWVLLQAALLKRVAGSGTQMPDAALDQSPSPLQAALQKHSDKIEPERGTCSALKD